MPQGSWVVLFMADKTESTQVSRKLLLIFLDQPLQYFGGMWVEILILSLKESSSSVTRHIKCAVFPVGCVAEVLHEKPRPLPRALP